jgi:hypothetical protein
MVQHCHAPFDDQFVCLYMGKVYFKYRQVFDKSTAFRMDPNPSVPHGYVVKHQWGEGTPAMPGLSLSEIEMTGRRMGRTKTEQI